MPVHGEYRMQKSTQAGLCLLLIVAFLKDNIFIMENGDVPAPTKDSSARRAGHFNAQDIYVDGTVLGISEPRVLLVTVVDLLKMVLYLL